MRAEQTIEHVLCGEKTEILFNLVLALFGVTWVQLKIPYKHEASMEGLDAEK